MLSKLEQVVPQQLQQVQQQIELQIGQGVQQVQQYLSDDPLDKLCGMQGIVIRHYLDIYDSMFEPSCCGGSSSKKGCCSQSYSYQNFAVFATDALGKIISTTPFLIIRQKTTSSIMKLQYELEFMVQQETTPGSGITYEKPVAWVESDKACNFYMCKKTPGITAYLQDVNKSKYIVGNAKLPKGCCQKDIIANTYKGVGSGDSELHYYETRASCCQFGLCCPKGTCGPCRTIKYKVRDSQNTEIAELNMKRISSYGGINDRCYLIFPQQANKEDRFLLLSTAVMIGYNQ